MDTIRQMVEDISRVTGTRMPAVVEIVKGGPRNAYATIGKGFHYEIHVGEALLDLPEGEVRAVLAHEMGHVAFSDSVVFGLCRIAFAISLVVAVVSMGWVAGACSAVGLAILYTGMVRTAEYRADMWAARWCGCRYCLVSWLLRLRRREPWYSSHPSASSRVRRLLDGAQ